MNQLLRLEKEVFQKYVYINTLYNLLSDPKPDYVQCI